MTKLLMFSKIKGEILEDEMDNKTARGTCLCGSVTLSFKIQKETFDACHCGMCRKWGGGPALSVDAGSQMVFTGTEFISTYQSSDWAERGFCNKCGTHLFYHLKPTGFRNVPLGLLENADQLKFDLQIFIDKKPLNYSFANQTKLMTQKEVFALYST